MNNGYSNTDLDLESEQDLSGLIEHLERNGFINLNPLHEETQVNDAILETSENFDNPEDNIAHMLEAIEKLEGPVKDLWNSCTIKEFNIGYDADGATRAFDQGLSTNLLKRIIWVNAAVRFTVYPVHGEEDGGKKQE